MKVALVRPRMITTGLDFISRQTPLNLCYLAAAAREAGAEVEIWDYDVEHFSERPFRRRLKAFRPGVLGISLMTPTAPRGARLAQLARQAIPGLLTVAGGPHVSALPEQTLAEFPAFDIGVFGEGEETLLDIMDRLPSRDFSNVPGLAYRSSNTILRNRPRSPISNLDSLPFPARDLLPIRRYRGQSYRGFSRDFLNIAEVATSRGCPNRCLFCAIQVTHGNGVRFRSPGNVIAELGHLVRKFGTTHIVFLDDTFTLKADRLHEIMAALKKLRLTWNCTTRVDAVDEELLREMVAHGCKGVAFGVESGSPDILELIGKNVSVRQARDAFAAAHRAGVPNIEADFMLGSHPAETLQDIKATQRLIKELRPTTLFLAAAVPYPGTPLWNMMQEEGLIGQGARWEEFLMFGGGDSWRTRHFSMRELRSRQREMLKKFYLSPARILRTARNARSIAELVYYFRSGLRFFTAGCGRLRSL